MPFTWRSAARQRQTCRRALSNTGRMLTPARRRGCVMALAEGGRLDQSRRHLFGASVVDLLREFERVKR